MPKNVQKFVELISGRGGEPAADCGDVRVDVRSIFDPAGVTVPLYPGVGGLGPGLVLADNGDRDHFDAPAGPASRSSSLVRPSAGHPHHAAPLEGSGPCVGRHRHGGLHGPVHRRQDQ
jgi:hypothetical protein